MHRVGLVQVEQPARGCARDRKSSYAKSRGQMRNARSAILAGIAALLCGLFATSVLSAADLSSYRGIKLDSSLAVASKIAEAKPGDARLVYQRPALIQELGWQPHPSVPSTSFLRSDSVRDGMLSFYNGDLFRIVITYDRYQIEGLTAQDLIDGISAVYGVAATPPAAVVAFHSIYGETSPVLARWEDPNYSWNLVRTGDKASYSLILYSKRLDALAQTAIVEAMRLDAEEAPQRERDRQKKRDDDDQSVLDKARSLNKPTFRP